MLSILKSIQKLGKSMMMSSRKEPIIFVIGCTGTGKSDLGVAIAKKYDGEVISVDSMQFYKGLDIATNKITDEEAEGVPHHMMSFIDPSSTAKYNVHNFRVETLRLIDEIRSRSKIPILVGGTTYYAESILYENNLIDTEDDVKSENGETSDNSSCSENEEDVDVDNTQLWKELEKVDPESARILHPNNRTRVQRALDIYRRTGRKKSELVREQKEEKDSDLGGKLRYENSLVVYMDATKEVLDERLDSRVDKMIRLGLKKELTEFYDQHGEFIQTTSYGVMQCIGLKEFIPWLQLEEELRETNDGLKLFQQGCDDVKLHTRQYAKRQRRWYKSRLLKRSDGLRKLASTKMLDTSDKTRIISDGMAIVDQWMDGVDLFEDVPEDSQAEHGEDANIIIQCDMCNMTISGKQNWKDHLNGKKHKHHLRKQNAEKL